MRSAKKGECRKTLGIADGCSRLFPAVLGTGDRKRTAAAGKWDRKRPTVALPRSRFKHWNM
jgi:hypothetical protein